MKINGNFDSKIKQITGKTETMGIEEMVLDMERKRGEKLGLKRGMERVKIKIITNMLNNDFSDEMIVKATGATLDFVNKIRRLNKKQIVPA